MDRMQFVMHGRTWQMFGLFSSQVCQELGLRGQNSAGYDQPWSWMSSIISLFIIFGLDLGRMRVSL